MVYAFFHHSQALSKKSETELGLYLLQRCVYFRGTFHEFKYAMIHNFSECTYSPYVVFLMNGLAGFPVVSFPAGFCMKRECLLPPVRLCCLTLRRGHRRGEVVVFVVCFVVATVVTDATEPDESPLHFA